jgi:glycine cleavage system H protein
MEYLETTVDKFTFRVATDRRYTSEGVWALQTGDAVRVGLSDFLQQHSGDIAFVEVKPAGAEVKAGEELAVIETIKVNLSLASPVSGKIARVNPSMESTPEILNQDPYGEGWLCEIAAADWAAAQADLMEAQDYFAHMKRVAEEEAK